MKSILNLLRRRFIALPLIGLIASGEGASLLVPATSSLSVVAASIVVAGNSHALPVDRAIGRQRARDSRQTGRQISRARRRGCYVLPVGAAVFVHSGYRYYRVGPRYYYPYMYNGRTVYIDIDVVGGYPSPPPPAGSIDVDIYVR
jgi:hypothetical protein